MMQRRGFLAGLIGALMLAACQSAPAPQAGDIAQTLILVRHAEKASDGNRDPDLTDDGQARAETLVAEVDGFENLRVFSTDTKRTRQTAAPTAARLQREIEIYDASDLAAVAAMLRALDGPALVVGHSNTTPQLAGALGGDAGADITEATEYDRIYYLFVMRDGSVNTTIGRFGAATAR